ncbi:MAG: DsrE family protein [Burkholderiaceae bacterium]|jgi:intracellular sulfur oxidation DsrE/DsrF family protein
MRTLFSGSLLLLFCFVGGPSLAADAAAYVEPHVTHPAFGEVKIVVPITTDDPKIWQQKLRNMNNALDAVAKWGGHATIKVVLYARGVRLLMEPAPELAAVLNTTRERGVSFLVCNNTLREANIDFHGLYHVSDDDVVPSGFLEVAWLAGQGYSVDPVN